MAQGLLTRPEQEATAIKVHARRQELQVDLSRKREVVEQLVERIHDLDEMAASAEEEEESTEGEDILAEIMATPNESVESNPPDGAPVSGDELEEIVQRRHPEVTEILPEEDEEEERAQTTQTYTSPADLQHPASEHPRWETVTSQTLRSRGKDPEKAGDTALSTSMALFGDRKESDVSPNATAEALLDRERAEQEALYESLEKMAQDLKASSEAFAATLEEDKDVVSQTGKGLEKNEQGLGAAARSMGTLRKITEGKGWWDRMILYAWIYGLMVVLILLVFVMPKLRFATW